MVEKLWRSAVRETSAHTGRVIIKREKRLVFRPSQDIIGANHRPLAAGLRHQTECMANHLQLLVGHFHLLGVASATRTMVRFGGPGLLALGVLDSSVVPTMGSLDILLIVLCAHHKNIW